MSNYRLKAAVIMTGIIFGGLWFYGTPKPEKVERPQNVEKVKKENPIHGFGYVDFEQVLQKHSKGAELKELIGKEIRLQLELNELLRPISPPKLPEIDTTPFEESAREKNMQNLISQMAELRARKKRIAAEYNKENEAEYIRRRNAIREVFANEAFNITLKLQNSERLKLTPEQVKAFEKRLDEITIERNQKQLELRQEWAAEVEAYVNEQTAEDQARIQREAKENEEKYGEEAMKKLRETQERNKKLMEAAIQEVAIRNTRRTEIFEELSQTTKDRAKLEDEIIESITNEAGKLGAMYKLQMVFVRSEPSKTEENFSQANPMLFKLPKVKSPGTLVFEGNDTKDLTKDLLKTIH